MQAMRPYCHCKSGHAVNSNVARFSLRRQCCCVNKKCAKSYNITINLCLTCFYVLYWCFLHVDWCTTCPFIVPSRTLCITTPMLRWGNIKRSVGSIVEPHGGCCRADKESTDVQWDNVDDLSEWSRQELASCLQGTCFARVPCASWLRASLAWPFWKSPMLRQSWQWLSCSRESTTACHPAGWWRASSRRKNSCKKTKSLVSPSPVTVKRKIMQ